MRCSRYATVTVVILACLAGCGPPESDRPLSDPELAKRDARLTGVWGLSGPGDRAVYLHFGGDRDEAVTDVVVVLHEDGVEVVRFGMFTTVIQGHHYMNLREKSLGDDEKGEPGKRGRYIFAKYAISKDGLLTISLMDVPYVAAAVRGGKLKGAASKSSHAIQSVRLTD